FTFFTRLIHIHHDLTIRLPDDIECLMLVRYHHIDLSGQEAIELQRRIHKVVPPGFQLPDNFFTMDGIDFRRPLPDGANDDAIGKALLDSPYRLYPVVLCETRKKTPVEMACIEGQTRRPVYVVIKSFELRHRPLPAPQSWKYTF